MTQEPAWLWLQPIGDRPWWGVNGAPPFVEVDVADSEDLPTLSEQAAEWFDVPLSAVEAGFR